MVQEKVKSDNRPHDRGTFIAGFLVTIYHFLFISIVANKISIVWFVLPLLILLVVLGISRRINPTLPLCYAIVCMFLVAEPSVRFSYVIWFAILPYFFILERERRLWALAGMGAWTGILIGAGIYAWLWQAMVVFFEFSIPIAMVLFLAFTLAIGLQHALFLPLAGWIRNRFKWSLALIVPGLYTVIEYWMLLPMSIVLSLSFSFKPFMLQPADLIGMHGVSFLIVLVSTGLYITITSIRSKKKELTLTGIGIVLVIIAFHITYGLWCFTRYEPEPSAPSLDIALIQPVAPLKIKNTDVEVQRRVASDLRRLSLEAINQKPQHLDLLIWPEGAGPFSSRTPEFNPVYIRTIMEMQRATSVTLLVQDIEFTRMPETGKLRYYSTVSLIEPVGKVVDSYRKNILMPFSEYLPLEKAFPFLRKWLPESRSILRGERALVLDGPGGGIAPLICYEVLFANFVRNLCSQECHYIANLTNDRWYGIIQQPFQHLGVGVARAIENRKPVARATNSGISALIDARGVITEQTQTMKKTFLRGMLYPRKGRTFYNRYGDILHPWILTPIYLALILYGCGKKYSSQRKEEKVGGIKKAKKRDGKSRRR